MIIVSLQHISILISEAIIEGSDATVHKRSPLTPYNLQSHIITHDE